MAVKYQVRPDSHWITAWGETKVLSEWADDPRMVVSTHTLFRRFNESEFATVEEAMTTPPYHPATYPTDDGRLLSIRDAWNTSECHASVTHELLRLRVVRGWSLSTAMRSPKIRRKNSNPW